LWLFVVVVIGNGVIGRAIRGVVGIICDNDRRSLIDGLSFFLPDPDFRR